MIMFITIHIFKFPTFKMLLIDLHPYENNGIKGIYVCVYVHVHVYLSKTSTHKRGRLEDYSEK